MRPRGSTSTSAIHFIISEMVSAVRADATEVPISRTKSSSTNGLQGGKVPPNFENKKNFRKKFYALSTPENMLNPLVKSVFKFVDN